MTDRFNTLKQLLSSGASSDSCLICNCGDNVITKGSTERQSFRLSFRKDIIKDLRVFYLQDGLVVVLKELKDVKFLDNIMYFDLSEEETFRLKDNFKANVQIKITLLDNQIIISDDVKLNVVTNKNDFRMLNDDKFVAEGAVRDQEFSLNQVNDIIAGSNNNKCLFYFDSSWCDFDKEYILKDEYNHEVSVVMNGQSLVIPKILTDNPGNVYIKIKGTKGDLIKLTEMSNAISVVL